MGKIQELPKSSSCLLTSSQIITSVYCVVKELVENALDSSSKNVEVKLEDYGLEKIEVKDNGCGIDKEDIQFVAKPHFTSKISCYSDLEKVDTYGFRGEALSAICAIADLVVVTKTSDESIGHLVNFSHDGQVISNKPFPCAQGTTVSVKNLFKNIPVRRQYYRSEKNKKDELRKVEDLLIAFGCILHDVRFALHHNRNLIWQKPPLSSTKNALIHILGNSVCNHLTHVEYIDEKSERKIEMFLPKPGAPLTCGLTSPSRCITAINSRPVRMKTVDKLLKEYYTMSIQNMGKSRYPICFISITTPLSEVDINIEPNKTSVTLLHSEEILSQLSEMLKTFYCTGVCQKNIPETTIPNQDLQSNTSDFLNSFKAECNAKIQQAKLATIADDPVSSGKHSVTNNSIINSSEKTHNSINKKEVNVVGTPNEPKKKKSKSILSKNDIDTHINTLKNFFPNQESSVTKQTDLPLNSLNGVPSVTVERSFNQNGLCSETVKNGDNIDTGRITTFAVSKNVPSDVNFSTNDNQVTSRKRHLSESSIFTEKLSEDVLKRPTLDLNDQNEELWSRGVHPSGGLFQPVKVLQPKTINIQESIPKESDFNFKKAEVAVQKKISFEKKLTPFDAFCRNNRLEVAAQNPELTNQQIAQILTERWRSLSDEEKAVFKNMLDKDYPQHIKKKERLGKIVSQNLSREKNNISPCKASKEKKPKVKEKRISFDIEKMRSFYLITERAKSSSEILNLINYLAPGIWICEKGRKLHILNTFRLQETIIYHRLLETFHFEVDPLDVPHPQNISVSHVGSEGMEVLHQLSNLEMNAGTLLNEKLTANGFNIRRIIEENDVVFELVGITSSIAFYGILDLKELLLLVKNKGVSARLSQCRPGKVTLYLQSEANRMSRQSPACQRVQDVEDLLSQKKHLPLNCDECIHYKPFLSELCKY